MEKNFQNELLMFQEFKKNYVFQQKEIQYINEKAYCDGFPLEDEEGNLIPISENWINVGYKAKNPLAKALSNLFPYEFDFKGHHLQSLESFFQGIKFPDAETQKLVFAYQGINAVHIQIASDYDWKETGFLYWQGQKINRYSEEYDNLVDEVYISAIQNPLFRQVLKKVDRAILHSIGKTNKEETVFTRYEFEKQLNCLVAFLKQAK